MSVWIDSTMFSSIKNRVLGGPQQSQSYELVDQTTRDSIDNDLEMQSPGSKNSNRSRSSSVLENINNYAASSGDVDDFTSRENMFTLEDRDFIRKNISGFNIAHFSKRLIISLIGGGLVIWVIGLMFYSGKDPLAVEKPKLVDLEAMRRGLFYSTLRPYEFLTPPSVDTIDEGLYINKVANLYHVKKASDSAYTETIFSDTSFEFNGQHFDIQKAYPFFDLTKILVSTNSDSQWRHSSLVYYWLYDSIAKTFDPITLDSSQDLIKLHFATFSPKGNYISFGYKHNLYYKRLADNYIVQMTDDGSDEIFNGKPDWVYEEEVLASDKAFWWSPDESNIVYLRTDESKVPTYELDFFTKGGQYAVSEQLKYPKPGQPNPKVTLINYSLNDESASEISHEGSNLGEEMIVYECKWINDESLLIKETDRESNILHIRYFNSNSNISKVTREIDAPKEFGGWNEKVNDILVIPPTSDDANFGYVDLVVSDSYIHLAYFENVDASTPKMLTSGNWNVIGSNLAFNPATRNIYFLATKQSSMGKNLMSVNIDDSSIKELTSTSENALYNVRFSPQGKYMELSYVGPGIPKQRLIDISKIEEAEDTGTAIENWEILNDETNLINNLQEYAIPNKTYHEISIDKYEDGEEIKLNVIQILPPNFSPHNKYPLLVHAYGGPGSQVVDFNFNVGFQDIISSQLNAVVLIIDPRGTAGKSWKFKSFGNNNIGYWEPRDIAKLTSYYIKTNTFINPDRTAIWGWSYGGFTTLKTLEFDKGETFKYGMAVAPVTDWLFYDSIYTERYMNLPSNNPHYQEAKVNNIDGFKTVNRFLIMHGTADDNVHFQNTLTLLDKFNIHNVENYDVHIFPDSDHSIYHNNANRIVYDKLIHWLNDAFTGEFDGLV